jgi:hypothetical protein
MGLAAITGVLAYASIGCAEERDPINRVQPNALPKAFFVGEDLKDTGDDPEFYMRNTVVDVPYGAGQDGLFTASYAQPVNRIKWEINEGFLVARQTYERFQNSDGAGSRVTNNGQVVAMFKIESHFDIKRDYNPQTGEENNIIGENASDRPWQERKYIRVDWSRNMVTDGYQVDSLSQIGLFGGIKFDPLSYYVSDPSDVNAPVFEQESGYFDITSKAFATPQIVDTPYGSFPACFFFGQSPVTNCDPTELTLRLSFRKVTDNDFEPTEWDGNKMDAFGWFYQDRYGYERNYGVTDQQWHHLAAKYNIWARSHISSGDPSNTKPAESNELFAQCGVDVWRDRNGTPLTFKVNGDGKFVTDGKTGLPIPDAAGKPFSKASEAAIGSDANADADGNKTADQCEFKNADGALLHQGSRCDTLAHRCTLPLHERTIKTIPWYYAPGSADDLFGSTARALNEWNISVKRAALIGQSVEATRVGKTVSFTIAKDLTEENLTADHQSSMDQSASDGKFVAPSFTDVFVLCHSPVAATDNPACGKTDTLARIGDLRYNSVNVLTNPQTPSPWGIMVDADDPITGEKVVTSVNEWGHVLDIASQGTEDLLRWINGEVSDSDITSGQYMLDWMKATKNGASQHQPSTLSSKEIKARIGSIQMPKVLQASPKNVKSMNGKQFEQAVSGQLKAAQQQLGPSLDSQFEGTRQSLIGSKFEAMLTTPEMVQAAGFDPSTPTAGNDAVLRRASTLRGMNPEMNRWMRNLKNKAARTTNLCNIEQPEPDSLVGMARLAQKLYPVPDKKSSAACQYDTNIKQSDYAACKFKRDASLHQWIREQFHISVILHEMGHSMGLRHNFSGTWDSLNYHNQYWQLRTNNGKEKACQTVDDNTGQDRNGDGTVDQFDNYPYVTHQDGKDCAGPRWADPVTETEVNGLIWKWGSSTVMDYPGDQTQDMNDLGKYDKAAMRFGYANVVDVDSGSKATKSGSQGQFNIARLDGFGGITGPLDFTQVSGQVGGLHYSAFQDTFKVLGTCTTAKDANDPLTASCTGTPLEYYSVYDMKDAGTGDRDPRFAIAPDGKVRHPYMFGSDEYADFGNMTVFRFDSGADAYEQQQFVMSTYENRYIFDNFRRNRLTFHTGLVVGRAQDRYFDKMTASTKALGLYLNLFPDSGTQDFFTTNVGVMLPHVLASSESFSTFIRVLTRPEPGAYYPDSTVPGKYASVPEFPDGTVQPVFNVAVGSGEGRYLHNDYDYSKGYNWGEYQTQVGAYYEKVFTVYYLMEAYNHFIQNSKQDYVDSRILNINYATLYGEQMRRIMSNLMQNNPMTLGPYVTTAAGGSAANSIARVQYLPWDKFDGKTPVSYPTGATVLNPLVGWEEQFPTLINGFYFGGTTLSMDWVQQMRIFSQGGTDTISIAANEQVHYTDPLTGTQYIARNFGSESVGGVTTARGSGHRMLQYATDIAKAAFVYTTDANGDPVWTKDPVTLRPVCQPALTADDCKLAETNVRRYSSNIDTLRELAQFLGYGPINRQ